MMRRITAAGWCGRLWCVCCIAAALAISVVTLLSGRLCTVSALGVRIDLLRLIMRLIATMMAAVNVGINIIFNSTVLLLFIISVDLD